MTTDKFKAAINLLIAAFLLPTDSSLLYVFIFISYLPLVVVLAR